MLKCKWYGEVLSNMFSTGPSTRRRNTIQEQFPQPACFWVHYIHTAAGHQVRQVTCQQVGYQGFFSYTVRSVSALNVSASGMVLLCLELHSILVFVPTLFNRKKTYLSQWTMRCWGKNKGTCSFHSTNRARPSAISTLGDAWG